MEEWIANDYGTEPGVYEEKPTTTHTHEEYVRLASREALRSYLGKRHGCVIVHRGRPVVCAYNRPPSNSITTWSFHAEKEAIHRAKSILPRPYLKECVIYIVRIGHHANDLRNSKPCRACQKEILRAGIRTCYYSFG
jgi:tRNA(Arg) A34 adenosine deaminase TadA